MLAATSLQSPTSSIASLLASWASVQGAAYALASGSTLRAALPDAARGELGAAA